MLFEGPKHKHLKQSIYRGVGGSGNATDDATIAEVSTLASNAANSASAAAASQTAAASSASGASTSATQAATSASNAASSATSAASSASSAASSVSTAAAEASAAASSAAAAAVSAGEASTSATNAANSASTSASARDSAETYMLAAQTAETNAETAYANTLAIYGNTTDVAAAVSAASGSSSSAASSASAAASSASSASTSATNAANSATAALASQNAAASSASNAASTASNITALFNDLDAVNTAVELSEGYKNDAGASAVSAAASASSASTSATNAASSATQAAASAASASAIVLGVASGLPDIAPTLNLDFANSKVLDPRITFTRASTATYYDGKTVAKAEENLLTYSQEFDNAYWSKDGGAVSANSTSAPDGTTTADTFTASATTGIHGLLDFGFVGAASTTYTVSVFLKKGTHRYISIGIYRNTLNSAGAGFDLDTNTVTGTGATGTGYSASGATITDVGGGWYRCSVVCVSGTTATTGIALLLRNTSYTSGAIQESWTAVGTETVIVWGAQLEQRSSVTAYTPTTTQPITNYIPALQTAAAGVARFDHNPVTGESLGLLIEEQRTNLLLRSEEFDNAAWGKSNATVTANAIISPDGTVSADKVVPNSGVSGYVVQSAVISNATPYTFSVFAKMGEHRYIQLNGDASSSRIPASAYFDLQTGVVSANPAGTASISSVGNGWYRCSITATSTSTASQPFVRTSVNGSTPANGDGYSGIYIWGAQLEAGAFPTSYIPTTSSQVTRSADAASMTGTNFSSWYRQDRGTLFVEQARVGTTVAVAYITDNTANNVSVQLFGNTATDVRSVGIFGASAQYDLLVGSITQNVFYKVASAYKTNDIAASLNGAAVVTDTSAAIPAGISTLHIGGRPTGTNISRQQYFKKLAYWPERLTDAQLQAITS